MLVGISNLEEELQAQRAPTYGQVVGIRSARSKSHMNFDFRSSSDGGKGCTPWSEQPHNFGSGLFLGIGTAVVL